MKRWRTTGKGPESRLVAHIPRKLLSSTRIILKNHESTLINTERKLQPHPRIIFVRLSGGARVAKCLPDCKERGKIVDHRQSWGTT